MKLRILILLIFVFTGIVNGQIGPKSTPNCTDCYPCVEPATYDADAQAYFDASGAPFYPGNKVAINNFIIGCKTDGIWDSIHAFYIIKKVLLNDNTPYWKYNLKDPRDLDEAYRLTYVNSNGVAVDQRYFTEAYNSDYYTYANTHYIFAAANRSNKHLMSYTYDGQGEGTLSVVGYSIGQYNVANGTFDGITGEDRIDGADTEKSRIFLSDNNNINVAMHQTGRYIASRINSTQVSATHDGTLIIDNVTSNVVAAEVGTPILIDYARLKFFCEMTSFASIGAGLSQAQMAAYDARLETLNTQFKDEEIEIGSYYQDTDYLGFPLNKTYTSNEVLVSGVETQDHLPIHICAQRDSLKVGVLGVSEELPSDRIYWSHDNGATWVNRTWTVDDETDASLIRTFHIFRDGKMIFSTRNNRLWKSNDTLQTITEVTLQNADGTDYVYHTPVNIAYPGTYFSRWGIAESGQVNGVEMFMWGNWGNTTFEPQGANPTNVYYSYGGDSVKVAYTFGQHPSFRDNGGANESTSGNLVGDPNNDSIFAYHVHNVCFNNIDTSFWAFTGEVDSMANWLRGKYNPTTDVWSWTREANGHDDGPWVRASSIWWNNDSIYWISDAYQGTYGGVLRIKDTNGFANTRHMHPIIGDAGSSIVWGDTIVSGRASAGQGRTTYLSTDGGETWHEYNFKVLPPNSFKTSGWLLPDVTGRFVFQRYYAPNAIWFYRGQSYYTKFNNN